MVDSEESKSGLRESWIGRGNNALMRGIGTPGVAVIGVVGVGLFVAGLLPFSHAAGAWPAANLVGILAIGLALSLVCAAAYAMIGGAAPRSGADYVLASRVLNGQAAFISSWVLVISGGVATGALVSDYIKNVFPAFVRVAGGLVSGPLMGDLLNLLVQTPTLLIFGTATTLIAFTSMFISQRSLVRMLAAGGILGLIAWGIMLVLFGTATPQAFQAAWDRVMGAGSYVMVISTAQSLGFNPAQGGNLMLPAGLVMGFWIFFGSLSSTYLAGEVKKPERTLLRGNWTALIVVGALLIGGTLLLQRVAPPDWIAAESYLSQIPGQSSTTMPWINLYAAILAPSLPLLVLLFLVGYVLLINLAQTYILYASRIMLAWAEDGLLPAGMAYVHPRFRSPLLTMLVAATLVQVGMAAHLAGGMLTTQANFLYFAAFTMLVPVTALTAFPFLKKNWFEACPAFVRVRLGPVPLVSIVGLITLAYLVYLMVSPLLIPGGIAPVSVAGIAVFGGEILVGVIWYVARRMALRARGIKLEEVARVIPRSS